MKGSMSLRQKLALTRLIRIAQSGTGQGLMTAEFLLSWWNARNFGGFDLTTLWELDPEIAADMTVVFAFVAQSRVFPDEFGYGDEFRRIVQTWHRIPECCSDNEQSPMLAIDEVERRKQPPS